MRYDETAVSQVLNFLENHIELFEDEFEGQPFKIEPWMERELSEIFGRVDDDGNPLVKVAYLEVPKKSAKTTLCAALILLALVCLRKGSGYEVYSTASTQKQAAKLFKKAQQFVQRDSTLSALLQVRPSTYRIFRTDDPTAVYEAIACDGDSQDGMNPAFVVIDELHRWRTRKAQDLWDVLTSSGQARSRTLVIAITTAGTETESPIAWRMHEKTLNIQRGIIEDPSFYGAIYGAKATDDWQSEETWKRIHPALECNGGHLKLKVLREAYKTALTDPAERIKFKRYYLNIWGESTESAVDIAEWDACKTWDCEPCTAPAVAGSLRHPPHEFLSRFVGRRCVVGADLSLTTDLSAVVGLFPVSDDLDDGVDVLPFFYAPEDGFESLEKKTGMRYHDWAREGWLHASPGRVIGTREIHERLKWFREMFDVQEFAFDPNNSRDVTAGLMDEGWQNIIEVPQSYLGMSAGTKKVLSLITNGKFHHGGHKVLRWNALCVSTRGDRKDNLLLDKPNRMKNARRIDGMSAAAVAMARLVVLRKPAPKSSIPRVGFSFV